MEILTLKPLRHQDTIEVQVVALDDSGATVSCTAQLTEDLSDIHTVAYDEKATVTAEMLALVRAEVGDYIKTHGTDLAAMLAK